MYVTLTALGSAVNATVCGGGHLMQMRAGLAAMEDQFGGEFYTKAFLWMKGGIDEATFISKAVPLMCE